MVFEFKINNDCIMPCTGSGGVTGNVNTYICSFDISCDYEDLSWFCVLKKGEGVYTVPIISGKCTVPAEMLDEAGEFYIGAYATGTDEVKRVSTNMLSIDILEGAYAEGIAPEVPEADAWEIFVSSKVLPVLSEAENAVIAANSAGVRAESAAQDASTAALNAEDSAVLATMAATEASDAAKQLLSDAQSGKFDGEKGEPGEVDMSEADKRYLPNAYSEGVVPVIKSAIDGAAKNCRIYGNSEQSGTTAAGVESVGDLVTEGEHTGSYRIDIKATGKNLIDLSKIKPYSGGTISITENTLTYTGKYYMIIYDASHIPVGTKIAVTFDMSGYGSGGNQWRIQYADGTYSYYLASGQSETLIKKAKSVFLYAGGNTAVTAKINNLQLEIGRATSYEPYTGQLISTYLSAPLRKYNNVSDYIDCASQRCYRYVNADGTGLLSVTGVEDVSISPILLKEGDNNIFVATTVPASNIKVDYYQNPTLVIDELRNAILALGGNV